MRAALGIERLRRGQHINDVYIDVHIDAAILAASAAATKILVSVVEEARFT
jgi:hypothetical protein